jgi:Tol biopolymer transport system component/predicted Ser/Thr protein kinase
MLAPGTRLGPYSIRAPLGAGGMGEVYEAVDPRLGRTVAIKILPPQVAADTDLRQRFEREAKAVSSLSHPHICTLFDVGRQDDIEFLVMEYLEGDTLAERLRAGALPVADALHHALEIAEALDAAHEKGIVHRDLKPANIKLTRDGVKLLDFGLAKVLDDAQPRDNLLDSSNATSIATRVGTILGTVGYMSPEQARGQPVDKRADIWAFGCIVFEALTGKPAFAGESLADTLAAVIEREPSWNVLPVAARGRVREVLQKCLRKDPAKRLRDVADARAEIEHALARIHRRTRAGLVAAAALMAITVAGAAAVWWNPGSEQTTIDPSTWVALTNFADAAVQPALSADGRMLTFIRGPSTFTTSGQIYVKQLPNGEAVPLTDDDLAKMSPVFSPDGARVAYTVNGFNEPWNTWEVSTLRGAPRRWLHNASGLTWLPGGELLFSEIEADTPIHMGIVASTETRTSSRNVYWPAHRDGMAHRSTLSPDGKWVLVVEMDQNSVWQPCRLVPFDGTSAGTLVGPPQSQCTSVAWAPDGKTMYFSANAGDGFQVWRQRFPDGRPEQLTSRPTSAEGLAIDPSGASLITSIGQRRRAVWVRDAAGERQASSEGFAFFPFFSADGRHLTYRLAPDSATGQMPTELWVTDLVAGTRERIMPGQLVSAYDLALDGRVVTAVPDSDGVSHLWLAWLDGREAPRRIPGAVGDNPRFGAGDEIIFRAAEGDGFYLFRIDDKGEGKRKISAERVATVIGRVSPNGEWLSSSLAYGNGGIESAVLLSTVGLPPVQLLTGSVGGSAARLRWSPDGQRAYLSVQIGEQSAFGNGVTYVMPIPAGSTLPQIPSGGLRSHEEIAALPGVETLPYGDVALGPTPGTYAYSREVVTRNLYRIPLD